MSIPQPKRHYYVIEYVPDTNRRWIRLAELVQHENSAYEERDLASRKEFEWYVVDPSDPDYDSYLDANSNDSSLEKAANYARSLAKEHNLEYIAFNNKDGILD